MTLRYCKACDTELPMIGEQYHVAIAGNNGASGFELICYDCWRMYIHACEVARYKSRARCAQRYTSGGCLMEWA